MNPEALLLVTTFVILLILDTPIAFAIGCATFLALNAAGEVPPMYQVAKKMSVGIESFPILAIPFFILAGRLMGEGGMASRLMRFANALVGGLPGGLAYVNTVTCMLFGSISGSATAAISSIGQFMIPEMEQRGYKREFSVALTSTAATTGLLIPPSNVMIVYAMLADGVSVAALFMAGVLPGVLVGVLIMLVCRLTGSQGDVERALLLEPAEKESLLSSAVRATPSLLLVILVLGGIMGGVFSATEAAAVAVAYAFCVPGLHWIMDLAPRILAGESIFCSAIGREIYARVWGWVAKLPRILLQSAKTTAMVMLLISTSQAMSWFLAYEQLPEQLSGALLGVSTEPIVILLIINAVLLVVGAFLDMTPAILIFTPIMLPAAVGLGVHPVHFGVIMIANLCIGLCTPPVGTCLFVGCSVGRTSLVGATRSMLPFYLAMLAALLLITYAASLSLTLPRWLGVM